MINPDNTVRRNDPRGIVKPEGSLDRSRTEKTKGKTEGVFERKKTKEELAEEWEEVQQKSEKGDAVAEEVDEKAKPVSLFDLAKSPATPKSSGTIEDRLDRIEKQVSKPEAKSTAKKGSLFDLASNIEEKKKPPEQKSTYLPEMPDLPAVNLMATPPQNLSAEASLPVENVAPPPPVHREELKKIIDQIVGHLYQLEKSGEKSLIIVINDPKSLFNKTSIKVTEFDSAHGQLNITMDNLQTDSKALVDKHQGFLINALLEKGYQVQQFVATTALENPRFNFESAGSHGSREKEPDKEPGGQREKERNKEQNE
jgi:hypothetical protein